MRDGVVSVDEATAAVARLPYHDMGFAKLDGHRALRKGLPEVVFCQGKTTSQVVAIMEHLASQHERVLATRAEPGVFEAVAARVPRARYHEASRIISVGDDPPTRTARPIIVATGGTSDIPVAEEAVVTARWMGCRVIPLYDVGVAGLHRLLDHLDLLHGASAVIAVAGMEGALASIVAGLVPCPVIAVPTSVGYGAHFQGLAPLLAMLNSCATGVAVVNIDNGFGAGVMAGLIALGASRPPVEEGSSSAHSPGE